jgi:hypothetical protein
MTKGGGMTTSTVAATAAATTTTSGTTKGGGVVSGSSSNSSSKHPSAAASATTTTTTTTTDWLYHVIWSTILLYMTYVAIQQAYTIRLRAIQDYGPVIHEFDPYFNYRATEVRALIYIYVSIGESMKVVAGVTFFALFDTHTQSRFYSFFFVP